MILRKRGKYRYGDSQTDIRDEVLEYSKANAYLAHHFAEAACKCGGQIFTLLLDDNAGVAVRRCVRCAAEHPVGDSDEYLQDAELKECACPCGGEAESQRSGADPGESRSVSSFTSAKHQNCSLAPNWMFRFPVALVMLPNDEVSSVADGLPKFVWLNSAKVSKRN